MSPARHSSWAPLVAALWLTGCDSGIDANYQATLSLAPTAESPSPDEEKLAAELRRRAALFPVPAEVSAEPLGDQRLTIRFVAPDRETARARLEALCQAGQLSVRAVHDQSVYFSDAAREDPAKIPEGYQVLTFSLQVGDLSRTEDLVVSTSEIINGSHVKRARPVASGDHIVFISLTVKGGQQMLEATKKMRKGRSRLAIIYDGRIISAPVVTETFSSDFTISGFNSFLQAQALAASLNQPLSTELLIESLKPLAP